MDLFINEAASSQCCHCCPGGKLLSAHSYVFKFFLIINHLLIIIIKPTQRANTTSTQSEATVLNAGKTSSNLFFGLLLKHGTEGGENTHIDFGEGFCRIWISSSRFSGRGGTITAHSTFDRSTRPFWPPQEGRKEIQDGCDACPVWP